MNITPIRITNLVKSYGGVLVVNNASIDVSEGKVSAIIGLNGAGKSSLIHWYPRHSCTRRS